MSTVGKSTQLYSAFDPRTIGGCALWLDAADSNTLTLSGSNVTQWNDKSGNGRHYTQSTASNQPTYGTFLSAPGVYFNAASNQNLSNTYVQAGTGGRNTIIVFYDIATATSTWGNPVLFFMGDPVSTPGDAWRAAFSPANNYLGIDVTGGAKLMQTSPAVTSMRTQRCIGMWGCPTGATVSTAYVYGNGVQFSSLVSSTGLSTAINTVDRSLSRIGGGSTGYVSAVISEVLHFSTELTTAQRQAVEGYLSRKWGLTNPTPTLPAIHPYRLAPPVLRSFTPLDISGCAMWFDAADQTSMTFSGSNVTLWRDKSGNSRNAAMITTGATFSNNALVFTGTQNYSVSNAGSLFSGSAFGIFIVEQTTLTTAGFVMGESTPTFSTNHSIHVGYRNSNTFTFSFWANDLNATASGSGPRIWSLVLPSGANRYMRLNGTLGATAGNASQLASQSGLQIGSFKSDEFYRGNLYEIIGYRGPLTTTDAERIETYLARKWGLRGNTPSTHLARISPGLSPQFLPTLLGNCSLWLDAADRTTLTLSGSNVTQWNDKSGNGWNATQSTASNQPIFSNNRLTFSGNQFLFTSLNSSNTQQTVFGVVSSTASTFNHRAFLGFNSMTAAGYGFYIGSTGGTTLIQRVHTWGGSPSTTGAVFNQSQSYIYDATISGTACVLYANGAQSGSGTVGALSASSTYLVGAGTGNTSDREALQGTIGELIVYNAVLPTADRQRVEGYLAQKWGLMSDLSTTNPYKGTPLY